MSMIVIDEDQYTPAVYYGAGSHTFTRQQIGTRYLMLALRTFVDPNNLADLRAVHALQDAVKVSQQAAGSFEIPNWDPVSHKKVRDALLVLYGTVPDQNRMFGTKEQVDPIRRLIGSAGGWGGNLTPKPSISTSIQVETTGRPSTSSPSAAMSRSPASGRSPFTMPMAVFRRTSTMRIRSTTSPPRKARTVSWGSSSAAATAKFPTACRPCPAGTTWCVCIARAPKS